MNNPIEDIEKMLLGALISGGEIPKKLTTDHFSNHYHKKVFQAAKDTKDINLPNFWLTMSRLGLDQIGGGIGYISSLTSDLPMIPYSEIILDCFQKLENIIDNENKSLIKTTGPTSLDLMVPDWLAQKIQVKTIYWKETRLGPMLCFTPNWIYELIDCDPVLANSYKYDYTMGVPIIAYSSTTIYKAALLKRLVNCGIPQNIIQNDHLERIKDAITHRNQNYNRIADFIDQLKQKYLQILENPLDRFVSFLSFTDEENRGAYTELFHLFLLRMHLHINGTRKKETGEYIGLIENDIVPVLEGAQKIGKTTLCRWLAVDSQLYIDLGSGLKSAFGDEETIKKVRGKLIAELGEMKIMKKEADVEQVKSFISRTTYEPNIKYVEYSAPIPATVSFIATSNPEQYLSDDTGNRRFWPVHLTAIDKDGLFDSKVLAEQLHVYYARMAESIGETDLFKALEPSERLETLMKANRQSAIIEYSDKAAILEIIPLWLENEKTKPNPKLYLNQHNIESILSEHGYNKVMVTRRGIKAALEQLGFTQRRGSVNGQQFRAWWKND